MDTLIFTEKRANKKPNKCFVIVNKDGHRIEISFDRGILRVIMAVCHYLALDIKDIMKGDFKLDK